MYLTLILEVTVSEAQAPAINYYGDVRVSKTMIKEDFKLEGLLERPISKSGTKNRSSRSPTSC